MDEVTTTIGHRWPRPERLLSVYPTLWVEWATPVTPPFTRARAYYRSPMQTVSSSLDMLGLPGYHDLFSPAPPSVFSPRGPTALARPPSSKPSPPTRPAGATSLVPQRRPWRGTRRRRWREGGRCRARTMDRSMWSLRLGPKKTSLAGWRKVSGSKHLRDGWMDGWMDGYLSLAACGH